MVQNIMYNIYDKQCIYKTIILMLWLWMFLLLFQLYHFFFKYTVNTYIGLHVTFKSWNEMARSGK